MKLRFAPSPTGYLHVGGARTALFNWLLARRGGGSFLLRIEDTDRSRSRPEHVDAITSGLAWLGLDWDEGPLFQADGRERHRRDALRLLAEGRAYRDFTSQDEFARARDAAVAAGTGAVTRLSRQLAARVSAAEGERRAAAGEPFALRFRVPDGTTSWNDLVHGATRFDNAEIEDFVILRSDGSPTYNLAVASDDAHAEITHVVRGDDHISNTPKQVLLYEALGRPVPAFGHLPMILGADGKRLSKRHGAQAVGSFREEGVLPDAMTNYLALLGWSPGGDQELLLRDALVARFSLERVLKKGAVFDPEKLRWLNGKHIAGMETEALAGLLRRRLARETSQPPADSTFPLDSAPQGDPPPPPDSPTPARELSPAAFLRLTAALAPRSRTMAEMAEGARPYVAPLSGYDPKAARKVWGRNPQVAAETLETLAETLARAPWNDDALEAELRGLAKRLGVGAGKLFQPLRLALTGRSASPGIFDVLAVLGRARSVCRVEAALKAVRSGELDCRALPGSV